MKMDKGLLILNKHKKETLSLVKVSTLVSISASKEKMMIPIKNKQIMFSYGTSFMEPKSISNQHHPNQINPFMSSNLRTKANLMVFLT